MYNSSKGFHITFSKAFSLTTNSLKSIFPKTNFSYAIIFSFSLIFSKIDFPEGKFYEIFTCCNRS